MVTDDVEDIDELAKDGTEINLLKVRKDLFDKRRWNETKSRETKGVLAQESKEFFKTNLKKKEKDRSKKIPVDKGTRTDRRFRKNFAFLSEKTYSTMSFNNGATAKRTIRSIKNLSYNYMDDFGYKTFHNLARSVRSLNFGWNCSKNFLS